MEIVLIDAFKILPKAVAMCAVLAISSVSQASAQSLIRDAEIESTLHQFGAPLFEAGGLDPSKVNIYIVNDDSLNAFVSGGQNMFLNTGFLMKSANPQEVIGVMAHETGHMTGGHNITRGQAMNSAMGTSWIAIGLGVLAVAAGAPDAGAALLASSQQAAALTFFKYTRIEESSADQAALNLLNDTHLPADGLVSFMEEIRNSEVLSARRQDPYYRTHPEVGPRIAALRTKAGEVTARAAPLPADYDDRLNMMRAKLTGFLHPTAVLSKYPSSDQSQPARYARAIAAHQTQDMTTALRETKSLIAESPDNPYFYELLGQILFENGRLHESIEPHRKSVELAPDQTLLYVNLARSLMTEGTTEANEEAESLLHKAITLDPGNGYAWKQLSFALGAMGREPEAELATAEAAFIIGDFQTANQFAQRALKDLDEGTTLWRRADDIAAITDARVGGGARSQGREGFSSHENLSNR